MQTVQVQLDATLTFPKYCVCCLAFADDTFAFGIPPDFGRIGLSTHAPMCQMCKAHLTKVGCLPVIVSISFLVVVWILLAVLFPPSSTTSEYQPPAHIQIMLPALFIIPMVVGWIYRRLIWPRKHENHASLDGPILIRRGSPGKAFIEFANDRYAEMFLEQNPGAKLRTDT